MTRRFSTQELRFLRNRVPIGGVIETLHAIASHEKNGKLSFFCPICNGLDTSINTAHNLAKCFSCKQNFNPIEFVMHKLSIDFVDSVKWLKKQAATAPIDANSSATTDKKTQYTPIGDILPGIMSNLGNRKPQEQPLESILQRVSRLEHQLSVLHRAVNELQSSLNR